MSVQSVRTCGRPYHHADMAEEGVAHCYWLVVVQSCDDTTWPNGWAPRVPHLVGLYMVCKSNGGRGVRPPDLP
jgi:hypothetical protein